MPTRLRQKMDGIDLTKLRTLHQGLHDYASLVMQQASTGVQLNTSTMEMDMRHLPLLAQMENHRNPGLNLHVFKAAGECHDAILQKQGEVQRSGRSADMRIVYPPFASSDHHVALDVRLRPGQRPSIIFYETSQIEMMYPQNKVLSKAIPGARLVGIPNLIQNSKTDCVMFSLNNALKSFKTHDRYAAKIHDGSVRGQGPMPPPEFLKHAHSKNFVEKSGHANSIVTKEKMGHEAQTLLHRANAYRADRGTSQYSTSIEGFRLQEIRRASEYLALEQPARENLAAGKQPKKSWIGR